MKTQATLGASVVTALLSTACCFGPLLLVTLGFSGAAAARMEGLSTLQPVFVVLTFLLMSFAFHRLYVAPRKCAPGEVCIAPAALRRQRFLFWFVVALIAAMALFPAFSEYLY